MPITIKTGTMKYKKPNGEYEAFNAVAQESTGVQIASIESAGAAQISSIQSAGAATVASIPNDYTTMTNNVSQLSEEIDFRVEKVPSTNIADFDYVNAGGYPASYKSRISITPLDTGVRLTALASIPNSTYIFFYVPIGEYYGKTLKFHCNVTKGGENTKPRFACRYWNGSSVTAIVNASSTDTLTVEVADEETATTEGYTHLRFEFYITYTSASITSGEYVDFTNIKISVGTPYDSKYTYPDWYVVRNAPQSMNNVEFVCDDADVYFEKSESSVYFTFAGSLYLRGIYANQRTLRMSYTGDSSAVRTFDAISALVTSPKGVEKCLLIATNTVVYYDFIDDKLKSCSIADVTDDMFVIFAVNSGGVVGGAGQYLYSSIHPSTEILEAYKEQKSALDEAWGASVQPVQIAQKKQFVFGIQTDTHYDPQQLYSSARSGNNYASNLGVFTQFVGMNFIANLGDIICGYAVNTQEDSRKAMTDIVNRYVSNAKCPVLFAVGNHDDGVLYTTSGGTQHNSIDEIITGDELYGRLGMPMYNTGDFKHGKELYYYIDFDDVRVIMLNTRDNAYAAVSSSDVNINRHNISNTQLAWFQNLLAESTGKKIIVMSHVGLVDGVRSDAEYVLNNGTAVVTALEGFKNNGGTVVGAFSGHSHAQMSDKVNGINYICFDDGGNFAEIVMVDTENNTIITKMVGTVPSADVDRTFTF